MKNITRESLCVRCKTICPSLSLFTHSTHNAQLFNFPLGQCIIQHGVKTSDCFYFRRRSVGTQGYHRSLVYQESKQLGGALLSGYTYFPPPPPVRPPRPRRHFLGGIPTGERHVYFRETSPEPKVIFSVLYLYF